MSANGINMCNLLSFCPVLQVNLSRASIRRRSCHALLQDRMNAPRTSPATALKCAVLTAA